MNLSVWVPPAGPVRRFAVANLINTIGTGMFIAVSALFFTRGLGLPVAVVARGLTAGLLAGLSFSIVVGRWSDRFGARSVFVGLLLLQAGALASYPLAGDRHLFAVVAVISGIADRGIAAVVGAYVQTIAIDGDRILARAQLRMTTNIGIALGALLAGLALASDTSAAYRLVVRVDAVAFLVTAVLVSRIHGPAPRSGGEALPRRGVWRDRRYLWAAGLNGWLSIHASTLSFALPIWVSRSTNAPVWIVSVLLTVNTVIVILLQAPVSGLARTFAGARRTAILAGCVLGSSCLIIGATAWTARSVTLIVLLAWIVALTLGELLQAATAFFAAYEMAPAGVQGQYQAAFALGPGITRAVAPLLFAAFVTNAHPVGWVLLGLTLVVAGTGLGLVLGHVAPPSTGGRGGGL